MEPARARYKNYVTDQRYHNAVNGTRNEMENLFVQIRTVSSTIGTLYSQSKCTAFLCVNVIRRITLTYVYSKSKCITF